MNDEFAFIANISPKHTYQSSLVKGIGDDAAVYRGSSEKDEVVCVDTMVEDVHFNRKTLTPFQIGKKALAVNISDLAAMGALPCFYLVSIAVPQEWSEQELKGIFTGMATLAKKYKMDLIGGDTVSATTSLTITVTVIGQVARGQALYRHTVKPGDRVFLTGYVGGSAAGLELLLKRQQKKELSDNEEALIYAHQEPWPHVSEGQLLSHFAGRISLNDVSDGVASEAYELAEASRVKVIIDADKIPFHPCIVNMDPKEKLEKALFGGEDYVLIGTVAEEDFAQLQSIFRQQNKLLYEVGIVAEGEPGVYLKEGQTLLPLEKGGYNHFQKRGGNNDRMDDHNELL